MLLALALCGCEAQVHVSSQPTEHTNPPVVAAPEPEPVGRPILDSKAFIAKIESDKERMFRLGAAIAVKLYDENGTRYSNVAHVVESSWVEFNRLMDVATNTAKPRATER